ncbi:TBC1 domain family member 2B isoform X3 [Cryptotermes secundus]|uniref:TBC1 domain family member 2B isoform X3 n=1 Tax=Cryptotermes secundus TaxID=105785 RepID=UPI000CD7C97D|nr:TBC1 domain family member 2B isoform X3 [Cryptotermes secundus]
MNIEASSNEESQQIQPRLCGYMTVGWNKVPSKSRWLVLSSDNCRLYVYKTEHDPVPIKDLDISRAVFLYDSTKGEDAQFWIRSGAESLQIKAGNLQRRDYWLARLRQERRSFGARCLYLIQHPELWACFALRGNLGTLLCMFQMRQPHTGLLSPIFKSSTSQVPQEVDAVPESPTMEPPVVLRRRPERADCHETSLFSGSSQGAQKSASERNNDDASNLSPYTFSSLGKRIRHSFREKRRSLRLSGNARHKSDSSAGDCDECKQFSSQVFVLQEDLKATEDEYEASRQVIEILQAQVEVLTREKEVLLEAHKRALESGENEMLGILQEKEVALTTLEQQCRKLGMQEEQLEGKVEQLQDDTALYRELLQAKDRAIVELTNQLHDSKAAGVKRSTQATQTDKMLGSLTDALEAYTSQNQFLNEELLEVNQLLQESMHREEKLLVEASEWEARFYQIQSKYMLLLNELQTPESSQNSVRFRELIARLMGDSVTGSTPSLRSSSKTYNVYGFQQEVVSEKSPVSQELNKKHLAQWDGIVTSLESLELHHIPGLKALIRSGIPYHHRGRVWKAMLDHHLRGFWKYSEPEYYKEIFQVASQPHMSPAAKQIETDLLRTLPSNKHYECMNADGIPKLRRVLLAFSIYNADVGYCQGLNRIVAILLLFLSEEDAFWGLVYIVEKLMPSDYYGQQLTGAQIDQFVLKDLIAEKLPRLASHLACYSVDISLVTFNWFLCIFIDSLPVDLFLQVWDAFLFEGSKVLFRYALAVLKLNEAEVMKQTDYVSILMTLKNRVENTVDFDGVSQVAFQDLNPFPMKIISQKREYHRKNLKIESEKLESVRREYRQKMVGESPDSNGSKTRFFN